jgi:hypothetical protein
VASCCTADPAAAWEYAAAERSTCVSEEAKGTPFPDTPREVASAFLLPDRGVHWNQRRRYDFYWSNQNLGREMLVRHGGESYYSDGIETEEQAEIRKRNLDAGRPALLLLLGQ